MFYGNQQRSSPWKLLKWQSARARTGAWPLFFLALCTTSWLTCQIPLGSSSPLFIKIYSGAHGESCWLRLGGRVRPHSPVIDGPTETNVSIVTFCILAFHSYFFSPRSQLLLCSKISFFFWKRNQHRFYFQLLFYFLDNVIGELLGDAFDRVTAQSWWTQSRSVLPHSYGRHLLEFGQLSWRNRDRRWAQVKKKNILALWVYLYHIRKSMYTGIVCDRIITATLFTGTKSYNSVRR